MAADEEAAITVVIAALFLLYKEKEESMDTVSNGFAESSGSAIHVFDSAALISRTITLDFHLQHKTTFCSILV